MGTHTSLNTYLHDLGMILTCHIFSVSISSVVKGYQVSVYAVSSVLSSASVF